MAEVIRRFNATFHFFFVLIIFGEVFTTLVGNVFGMTKQMQSITGWKNHNIIFFILLISYCFSYIGYSDLLHILYPIIGWVSIVILPIIAFKNFKNIKASMLLDAFYVHSNHHILPSTVPFLMLNTALTATESFD